MLNNKKGSELSMNVIIIAAIALLVLVILSVLVLQKFGKLSEGTSCVGLRGECVTEGQCMIKDSKVSSPADDCDEGLVCCYTLGTRNS